MPPACVVKTHAVEISEVAQFITVCGASNLVEARCISSPLQGSSPAKTRAFSRPSRAHGHHLRPSTNCEKLSDLYIRLSNLQQIKVVQAGGIASHDLGACILRHSGQDLRQNLSGLWER